LRSFEESLFYQWHSQFASNDSLKSENSGEKIIVSSFNIAYGFFAKPDKVNNTIDLTSWTAGIPGKKGTDWEGGLYKVKLTFPKEYPQKPPQWYVLDLFSNSSSYVTLVLSTSTITYNNKSVSTVHSCTATNLCLMSCHYSK
jgi:hypothetical protein